MEFTKEQLIARADHLLCVGKAFIADHPGYDGMAKDVELFKIALASLEAEKERKHHSVIAEQLAHVLSGLDATDHQRAVISCAIDRLNNVAEILQRSPSALPAPPAPVSVPDEWTIADAVRFCKETGRQEAGAAMDAWNACRAAMLQGADGNSPAHSGCRPAQNCISPAQCGNSPAIPDGWVMVPEEPTHEMLEAGDEQFGTYDVYRRMIAASPQQK